MKKKKVDVRAQREWESLRRAGDAGEYEVRQSR